MQNSLINSWLRNGITALGIGGIYAIILVLLRSPQFSSVAGKLPFQSALVIHVNLSILVWLLSINCLIWSYGWNYGRKAGVELIFSKLALAAVLMIAISPLTGENLPVMNNYIPMLENIIFILGLSLFAVTVLGMATVTIYNSLLEWYSLHRRNQRQKKASFRHDAEEKATKETANKHRVVSAELLILIKFTSAVMFIGVWICFICSYFSLKALTEIVRLEIDYYYELLYWSGGHLLQFIYTQTLMLVWLVLFEAKLRRSLVFMVIYRHLFILNFICSLVIFYAHINYNIADGEFKEFVTDHMRYTAGIAPVFFIITLALESRQNVIADITADIMVRKNTPDNIPKPSCPCPSFVTITIISSSLLFFSGGLMGIMISGMNVTIPAHYHGSIVGISIALMGFVYFYCYNINYPADSVSRILFASYMPTDYINNIVPDRSRNKIYNYVRNISRIADYFKPSWQLYILTVGQSCHILGLYLAGGYGVLRKTLGGQMNISAKIYMSMMGAGGMLAIIGGLMFVAICIRTIYFGKFCPENNKA